MSEISALESNVDHPSAQDLTSELLGNGKWEKSFGDDRSLQQVDL